MEVISSEARQERWAHIRLSVPVMFPRQAAWIASLLGVDADDVLAVARCDAWLEAEGAGVRVVRPKAGPFYKVDAEVGEHLEHTGAGGVAAHLVRLGHCDTLIRHVPVAPPALRPLSSQGLPRAFDLALASLMALSERVDRLDELMAPEAILVAEIRGHQRAWEELVAIASDNPEARPRFDVRVAPPIDDALYEHSSQLYWTGPSVIRVFANGTHVAFSPLGEVFNTCAASMRPPGKFRRASDDQRYVVFQNIAFYDADDANEGLETLSILDTATGAWLSQLPDPTSVWWTVREIEGWLRFASHQATGPRVRDDEFEVVSGCGRFVWIGESVYALGTADFTEAVSFAFDPEEPEGAPVIGEGPSAHVEGDAFYELIEAFEGDARTLGNASLRLDGPFLVDASGTRAVVRGYELAAFSPDGASLALWTKGELSIVDLETLHTRRVEMSDVRAALSL
ncbi:MAG: hypothetical protein AAGE52_15840 [Myxococcota bacterium]